MASLKAPLQWFPILPFAYTYKQSTIFLDDELY